MLKESRQITCYETDAARNLKPYAFMNLAQEMANQDALELGFGYEQLIEKQTIWVLSRVAVRILRPPVWREPVVMETWHKGEDGIFWLRDFLIRNRDETEDLVRATSSWLIIHANTRRIQRPQHILNSSLLQEKATRHAIATPCEKIPVPETGLQYAVSKKVCPSDLDFNHHTNNARYIEWAMDCLDTELVTKHYVEDFRINFNAESRLSETLDFFVAETAPLSRYIEGRKGEKNVFQVQISFKG
ncbi:MAG: thioesterase [Bacteroidales bacterium]|nr:thioesterase [Bacteroidales bacterium]MDD3521928.1 thioesterase [Bacteroidales bacterium]MDD4031090.1 thioesterase [Bacteroidales bacterium]MDD4434584.1 thioesterase [Bacteroidales bacterium]MDD5732437.1 thioesterase [Bacteroidales bacterium]